MAVSPVVNSPGNAGGQADQDKHFGNVQVYHNRLSHPNYTPGGGEMEWLLGLNPFRCLQLVPKDNDAALDTLANLLFQMS